MTISQFTENTFDLENAGNINSKTPTYLVTNVPVEVDHVLATSFLTWGIIFSCSLVTKIRSPSDPLSRRVLYQTVGKLPSMFSKWFRGTDSIEQCTPPPVTTFSQYFFKVATLIGVLGKFTGFFRKFSVQTFKLVLLSVIISLVLLQCPLS